MSAVTLSERKPLAADPGAAMHALCAELYPLCRSLTGPGVRATLEILSRYIPLGMREVPTGKSVFDWIVPQEWHIRDAYIADQRGRRVVDFRESNLHVVNGSVSVRTTMTLAELRPHLHTLPEHPDWIPYRTSYYGRTWGFCLAQRVLDQLTDQTYTVVIDSDHRDGSLTYGELLVPGQTADEVLISTHACHPSLANDNLSGIAVSTFLARWVQAQERRYSYRFVFVPATIGPLCWLTENQDAIGRIKHGLVLTLLGTPLLFKYKQSRRGDAEIDRAAAHVFARSPYPSVTERFSPLGFDERQYCSPGFNLPVGCLTRSGPGDFPQYHTSADNLDFIQPQCLAQSLERCLAILSVLEANRRYRNLLPFGEPQLGRRGLYRHLSGTTFDHDSLEHALLWTLNYSDGQHDLLAIAELAALPFEVIAHAARLLAEHQIIAAIDENRNKAADQRG
jgi:aminopeptidase-like protein